MDVWARLKTMTPSELRTFMEKAQGGDAEAQCWVGRAYSGLLLPRDGEEAARWFLKSALLYMEGRGVRQDYMQAYFWFSLNGHEGNAADAKSHLSLQQTRETDGLVKEWKEQHRLNPEVAAALHIEN